MGLIDADEFYRMLQNYRPYVDGGLFNAIQLEVQQVIDCLEEELNDAPTIDAVEVVRCKDCRWYDKYSDVCHNPRYGDGHANYQPPYVDEEYWCKDGERREP